MKLSGTMPLCFSIRIFDRACIARAFVGASPHVCIIFCIVAMPRRAMSCGLLARANSSGVMLFTRLSVHCAEWSTAISSVYGVVWCSGISGCGYSSSRICVIFRAFEFIWLFPYAELREYCCEDIFGDVCADYRP